MNVKGRWYNFNPPPPPGMQNCLFLQNEITGWGLIFYNWSHMLEFDISQNEVTGYGMKLLHMDSLDEIWLHTKWTHWQRFDILQNELTGWGLTFYKVELTGWSMTFYKILQHFTRWTHELCSMTFSGFYKMSSLVVAWHFTKWTHWLGYDILQNELTGCGITFSWNSMDTTPTVTAGMFISLSDSIPCCRGNTAARSATWHVNC